MAQGTPEEVRPSLLDAAAGWYLGLALANTECQRSPKSRSPRSPISRSPISRRRHVPMNLQPLEDRIVIRPGEAGETTVTGLVIPDTAKEKPQQGEVLAVGPGRRSDQTGELIPLGLA